MIESTGEMLTPEQRTVVALQTIANALRLQADLLDAMAGEVERLTSRLAHAERGGIKVYQPTPRNATGANVARQSWDKRA